MALVLNSTTPAVITFDIGEMSGSGAYGTGYSDTSFRRKFTSSREKTEQDGGKPAKPPTIPDEPTRLLEARTAKVNFDATVGKTQLVTAGAGRSAQAGFWCTVCNVVLKDSVSYIDHINSRVHLKQLGVEMRVKKSTAGDVQARLEALKRKKEQKEVDYDFNSRVAAAQEDEARERRQKREKRKRAKLEKYRKTTDTPDSDDAGSDGAGDKGPSDKDDDEVVDSDEEWAQQMEAERKALEGAAEETKRKKRREKGKPEPEPEFDVVVPDDDAMAQMMGFGGFGSSKS
ncbi:U4/U6.U5 snRNP associated protein [Sorochytrium milnesiophthora]